MAANGKTLVLFDIDGTLLYSEGHDSRCFARSYQSVFGRPFPTIDWTRFTEVTDHVIFRTAFHDHFGRYPTAAERDTFEDHYLAGLRQMRRDRPGDFREVPGAGALWRTLSADPRFVTGIATGGWQRPAAVKLAHVGLPPDVAYAGYANGMFSRVDILNEAIGKARRRHRIERVVYVGDAVWDVTTTAKMQLPLIGIRRRGDHDALRRHGARYVLTDYRDATAFHTLLDTTLPQT